MPEFGVVFRRRLPGAALDWVVAALLFATLTAVTWRRWTSFQGDLNREWTTPARLAAGERLYSEVGYYYGPLAPYAAAAAFRAFGSRVGTYVAVGLTAAAGTVLLVLLAARRLLPRGGWFAVAGVAIGVLAFATENGALPASYALAAVLAIGLTWGAYLGAAEGRPLLAGLLGGLAILSKVEAGPALLGAALLLRGRALLAFAATAGVVAGGGMLVSIAGIPVSDLVSYGPLRHFRMPPEFRELYTRVSGLHPLIRGRGIPLALLGACAAAAWAWGAASAASAPSGTRRQGARAVALLGAAAAALLLARTVSVEPVVTTLVRGLPLLVVGAGLVAALRLARRASDPVERRADLEAAAASVVGLGFAWRTFFWTVPSHAYPPMAALSALPAAAWLLSRVAPSGLPAGERGRAAWLAVVPFLLAPFLYLPRLVEYYRSPRTAVVAPRGTWIPPGGQGELFQKLVDHLTRVGVKDRDLVVMPEATALGFLLGVRSPLRFEQILPGHVDAAVDRELAGEIDRFRPRRIVFVARPTPEFGPLVWGKDYAVEIARRLARDYVPEVRLAAKTASDRWDWAVVYVRTDAAEPGTRTPGNP